MRRNSPRHAGVVDRPSRKQKALGKSFRRMVRPTDFDQWRMLTTMRSSRTIRLLCGLSLAVIFAAPFLATARAAQPLPFQSQPLTPVGEYTFGIEGPAVDAKGNLYVVNFGKQGTIGKLPAGSLRSELFATLPAGSIGVAIRFDRDGRMFVADYKQHTIFLVAAGGATMEPYFHSDEFNQPNDMTVAADGTIYASDPNWKRHDGQIWRIAKAADGSVHGDKMLADRPMGTTNGIDLSPDGKTLYVGESDRSEIWSYRIDGARLLAPRLLTRFDDFSIDGIRTDISGRLFVARIMKGTIAVLSPAGKLEREINLSAREPTNLAFGGADGKSVFVTQRHGGLIESFRTDRPGREYCLVASGCFDKN
jgi:sugar lactone lactonase YvrE